MDEEFNLTGEALALLIDMMREAQRYGGSIVLGLDTSGIHVRAGFGWTAPLAERAQNVK